MEVKVGQKVHYRVTANKGNTKWTLEMGTITEIRPDGVVIDGRFLRNPVPLEKDFWWGIAIV